MELIIDFDSIKDNSKKEWLINTLTLMGINFRAAEKPQTLEEYNRELEAGNEEIENGDFITAKKLKQEANKW
ncbi:MAG: hypothetical protein KF845_10295 [Cyclobacteriaceae bacterium]|nr:hypothetical protein [Cyclobacteriaceae bacterium]